MLSCSDNKQYESIDLQMCNLYGNVRHCESYTMIVLIVATLEILQKLVFWFMNLTILILHIKY